MWGYWPRLTYWYPSAAKPVETRASADVYIVQNSNENHNDNAAIFFIRELGFTIWLPVTIRNKISWDS